MCSRSSSERRRRSVTASHAHRRSRPISSITQDLKNRKRHLVVGGSRTPYTPPLLPEPAPLVPSLGAPHDRNPRRTPQRCANTRARPPWPAALIVLRVGAAIGTSNSAAAGPPAIPPRHGYRRLDDGSTRLAGRPPRRRPGPPDFRLPGLKEEVTLSASAAVSVPSTSGRAGAAPADETPRPPVVPRAIVDDGPSSSA
jgi:hypothetical protein